MDQLYSSALYEWINIPPLRIRHVMETNNDRDSRSGLFLNNAVEELGDWANFIINICILLSI